MKKFYKISFIFAIENIPFWIYELLKLFEKNNKFQYIDYYFIEEIHNQSDYLYETNSSLLKKILKLDRKIFHTKIDAFEKFHYKNLDQLSSKIQIIPNQSKESIINFIDASNNYVIPIGFKEYKSIFNKLNPQNLILLDELNNNLGLVSKLGLLNIIKSISVPKDSYPKGYFLDYISQSKLLPLNRGLNSLYMKYAVIISRTLKNRIKGNNSNTDKYGNYFLIINHLSLKDYLIILFKYWNYFIKNSILGRIFVEQWALFYNCSISNKNDLTTFEKYNLLQPPKNTFWADPHIVSDNTSKYLFIEEFDYKKGKAHLSVIKINNDCTFGNPIKILDKPYHLSYPFVFNHKGTWYLIPETSENKTIQLYKATNFPLEWHFVKNLMNDVLAVDTNLFYYNRKWWMFTTISESEHVYKYDELWIFYSNNFLENDWVPHKQNPVVKDIKSSRPAGNIFKIGNNIYRPAQNSRIEYGHGLTINKILTLNEKEYKEESIIEKTPHFYKKITGVHTINFQDNFAVIDGKYKKFRLNIF